MSFFIAVIVGLGIGGGGFFVIYLTLCLNYGQIVAQGTNLLFFLISALASLFVHMKRRSLFSRELIPIILISVPATVSGAYLANILSPKIAKITLGILLTASGFITFIKVIRSYIREKNKKNVEKDFTK